MKKKNGSWDITFGFSAWRTLSHTLLPLCRDTIRPSATAHCRCPVRMAAHTVDALVTPAAMGATLRTPDFPHAYLGARTMHFATCAVATACCRASAVHILFLRACGEHCASACCARALGALIIVTAATSGERNRK